MCTVRTYVLIGLVFAAAGFLIITFFGPDVAAWARSTQADAVLAGQSTIGRAITDPIIFVMENKLIGTLIFALAWPAVVIWFVLIILLLILVAASGVGEDIQTQTGSLLIRILT